MDRRVAAQLLSLVARTPHQSTTREKFLHLLFPFLSNGLNSHLSREVFEVLSASLQHSWWDMVKALFDRVLFPSGRIGSDHVEWLTHTPVGFVLEVMSVIPDDAKREEIFPVLVSTIRFPLQEDAHNLKLFLCSVWRLPRPWRERTVTFLRHDIDTAARYVSTRDIESISQSVPPEALVEFLQMHLFHHAHWLCVVLCGVTNPPQSDSDDDDDPDEEEEQLMPDPDALLAAIAQTPSAHARFQEMFGVLATSPMAREMISTERMLTVLEVRVRNIRRHVERLERWDECTRAAEAKVIRLECEWKRAIRERRRHRKDQ